MAPPYRETPQCHVLVAVVSRCRGTAADVGLLISVACLSSASSPPCNPSAILTLLSRASNLAQDMWCAMRCQALPTSRLCRRRGQRPLPLDNDRRDLSQCGHARDEYRGYQQCNAWLV